MAELHVVSALRNKRAELAGMVGQFEQQLARQRTNLAHLDATMRLFDPDIRPQEIRAKQQRARSAWFRQGECASCRGSTDHTICSLSCKFWHRLSTVAVFSCSPCLAD